MIPPQGFVRCSSISEIKVGDLVTQRMRYSNTYFDPHRVTFSGLRKHEHNKEGHWWAIETVDKDGKSHEYGSDLRHQGYADTWYRKSVISKVSEI